MEKLFVLKKIICFYALLLSAGLAFAQQEVRYTISFEKANHHLAKVSVTFPQTSSDTLYIRMSRSSPGRYALHEFAKNVNHLSAVNQQGDTIEVLRKDPHQWMIPNPKGTTTVNYTLFANRGDGTYAQIDLSHAHLNIPATFMYAEEFFNNPVEVTFVPRKDLNWKIATQMPLKEGTTYTAPNFQYFFDSPTELSNFRKRSFEVESKGKSYTIEFVLHDHSPDDMLDAYFEQVKGIVLSQKQVYKELPEFDYKRYTFIACYIENASGDGMEHRNSTILTDKEGLANGGMENNIGTVAHEFFHAWNVERLRPKDLEPFDYAKANMTGTLWFAEGFTSYYTNLTLCRAGIIDQKEYVKRLNGTFNYVWNSPARELYNPIEMSYQAPFVDAATAVDEIDRGNTFVSYYSYGSMLGLALDLSLRQNGLTLDDFMKEMWEAQGKSEDPYTIDDLHFNLSLYAGKDFADHYFNSYIYKGAMPDFKTLFESVGILMERQKDKPYTGIRLSQNRVVSYPLNDSPAHVSGLTKGDRIVSINDLELGQDANLEELLSNFKAGDSLNISFLRFGAKHSTQLIIESDPTYHISLDPRAKRRVEKHRDHWLKN